MKLVNVHYFKYVEIDLFVYASPKEGLCGMHTVQASSSVGQHQMIFYIFHSIKIWGGREDFKIFNFIFQLNIDYEEYHTVTNIHYTVCFRL
jgi:hypothetical protein